MKGLIAIVLLLGFYPAFSQRTNEGDVEITFTNTFLEEEESLSVKLNSEWFYRTDDTSTATYWSEDHKIYIIFGGSMGTGYTRKDLAKMQEKLKDGVQSSILPGDILKAVMVSSESGEEKLRISYAVPTLGDKMIIMSVGLPQSYRTEWEPYFDKVAQTFKLVE